MPLTGSVLYECVARDKDLFVSAIPKHRRQHGLAGTCTSCGATQRERFPEPIEATVTDDSLDHVSYSRIFDGGPGVIRDDLLAVLQPYMPPVALGPCRNRRHQILSTHATVYSSECVSVRGDVTTTVFVCDACGVSRVASDAPYILASSLSHHGVLFDNLDGMYVTHHLRDRVSWRCFDDIELVPIPVLPEPRTDDPLYLLEHAPDDVMIIPLRTRAHQIRSRRCPRPLPRLKAPD